MHRKYYIFLLNQIPSDSKASTLRDGGTLSLGHLGSCRSYTGRDLQCCSHRQPGLQSMSTPWNFLCPGHTGYFWVMFEVYLPLQHHKNINFCCLLIVQGSSWWGYGAREGMRGVGITTILVTCRPPDPPSLRQIFPLHSEPHNSDKCKQGSENYARNLGFLACITFSFTSKACWGKRPVWINYLQVRGRHVKIEK